MSGSVRTVLVTGGAGFIGSNLVAALLNRGDRVRVLDNLFSGRRENLPASERLDFVTGDIRDEHAVRAAVAGCDVVFHLAASVGNKRSIDAPVEDAEINVIGTIRILEASRASKVRRLVVSSSAGVFGELKTIPIHEDHPVEPDSPYGCTKLCEEKLSLAYGKLYGLDVVCLRYFNVFGRNQRFDAYGNVIPIFVFQTLRKLALTVHGDGEQTRDFIHVSDVVQANLRAAESQGVSGAFNIGSGTRITINRLIGMIREVSGLDPVVQHGPSRPGDVRESLADVSAARRAFAFEPGMGMRDGLADYLAWARTEVAG